MLHVGATLEELLDDLEEPCDDDSPFDDRDSSDRGQEFDTRLALGLEGAKDALDCRFSNFGDRFPEDLEHLVD